MSRSPGLVSKILLASYLSRRTGVKSFEPQSFFTSRPTRDSLFQVSSRGSYSPLLALLFAFEDAGF